MGDKSWKKESDWTGFYRKMSNATLIKYVNDMNSHPGYYRGTVLRKVANAELARRKAAGTIRMDAGKKKARSPRRSTMFPF